MSTKELKQIGLGLVTTVVILSILDLLPSLVPEPASGYQLFGQLYLWGAVEGALFMFIATLAGAYVARTSFIGPAVLLAIGIWVFVVYTVNSIAAVAGQGDILSIAVSNILGLFFLSMAAGVGAHIGRRISNENEDNASAAA